ncbi:helix-turn-helix transcriptional regulator [Serpentinicella sp. ANB-PHB4]|uniref:helix-turn-helix domain-containing protein n=1 Tax=Serpentinicella sp. ANB-PHB4 TaxID=3074076 RepID=UPI00286756EB|nr:helix-turn-helix transcriptional regulator [Serpentinicella sp. ANB-PHB4]MDR5659253.1 helix-turn-helix transcriptional regulator [Serpentinicella sp. ANB-PHB4]
MALSYNRLWKLAIDKGINKTQLRDITGISNQTLSRLSKNQYISMEVLDRICNCLECNVEDIIEHIKIDEEKK